MPNIAWPSVLIGAVAAFVILWFINKRRAAVA